MRRTTCTVLALAFVAVSAIGCGSDDDDTASGGAGSGASGSGASGSGGSGATGGSGAASSGGAGSGGEASGGAGGGSASGGAGGGADADAEAMIVGEGISGTASFFDEGGQIKLVVTVTGAPDGAHGFHIHQMGQCEGDFSSAGGHWDDGTHEHGMLGSGHWGDVGNVDVSGGTGTLTVTSDLWTLGDGGDLDVIGHSVILHENGDDFTPNPSVGDRIACGVIQAAN
jgi:Cu-Zn family superoxide dismutase